MAKAESPIIPAPRENPLLFGHQAAEQRFLDEVTRGLTHHAYLITGPKGIGKATLAYRFARYMLAPKAEQGPSLFGDALPPPADTLAMSAEDPLFRRVAAGSHSDLLLLSPSVDPKKGTERAEITAEEARQVPGFMNLTPAEGEWRIAIVDAVDQLNNQAANALLKVLEEPPEKAMIFLICHEPGATLATIRSRCRHFRVDAPDAAAFHEVLINVAPHIERADYPPLYVLAFGSPGFAITLNENKAVDWYDNWLNAMLPQASSEARNSFAEKAASMKTPQAWDVLLHGWRTALYRASTFPAVGQPITTRERDQLAAIAATVPLPLRQRWLAAGRALIAATDTFNLDKKATIRLLLSPERLDTLMAA